jgi:hypothetical protein
MISRRKLIQGTACSIDDYSFISRMDHLSVGGVPAMTYTLTSRENGMADLEDILGNPDAILPLNWLFFTDGRRGDEGVWIYLCSGNDSHTEYTNEIFARNTYGQLLGTDDSSRLCCSFYSVKPLGALLPPYKEWCEEKKDEHEGNGCPVPTYWLETESLPTANEVYFHLMLEKGCKSRGLSSQQSTIVCPAGTFTFSSSDRLKRRFRSEDPNFLMEYDKTASEQGRKSMDIDAALDIWQGAGLDISYKRKDSPKEIVIRLD